MRFDSGAVLRRTKRFARVGTVSSMSPLIWIQPANLAGFFLPAAGERGASGCTSDPGAKSVVPEPPIDIPSRRRVLDAAPRAADHRSELIRDREIRDERVCLQI